MPGGGVRTQTSVAWSGNARSSAPPTSTPAAPRCATRYVPSTPPRISVAPQRGPNTTAPISVRGVVNDARACAAAGCATVMTRTTRGKSVRIMCVLVYSEHWVMIVSVTAEVTANAAIGMALASVFDEAALSRTSACAETPHFTHRFDAVITRHPIGTMHYTVVYLDQSLPPVLPFDGQPRLRIEADVGSVLVKGAWQPSKGRWYKRGLAHFIDSARRAPTRAARLAQVEAALLGTAPLAWERGL